MADCTLTFNSYHVATVHCDPAAIFSVLDSEYPRLLVPLQFTLRGGGGPHPKADLLFDSLTANLSYPDTSRISDALPTRMASLRKAAYTADGVENVVLEFPLDTRRLEWIEAQRDGDLRFRLWVSLRVSVFGSPLPASATPGYQLVEVGLLNGDLWVAIPESQWREKLLPGLGCGRVQVVELPVISLETCSALNHSHAALKKAEQHLRRGLYDEAAGQCRVALDPFFEQVDKPDGTGKMPVLRKSWEKKLGEATHAWLDKCLSAIKGATNVVHHKPTEHFDRFEAQMLFMITTALVSYAARTLDVSEK